MMDCIDHDVKIIPTGRICLLCGKFWASVGNRHRNSFRTPEKPTSLPVRESDLVAGIVEGLRFRGRTVLRVGQWRADKSGNDPGVPDLLVWQPCGEFGIRGWWVGLEVKTDKGRLSATQRLFAAEGKVIVVRSIAEAFAAVGETL